MFASQIAAALDKPHTLPSLDALAHSVWRALGAGHLDDGEAQRLAELVEARRVAIRDAATARRDARAVASRIARPRPCRSPDRAASIARRRRHAASGGMPSDLAADFTTGQLAALTVVAREAIRSGACWWPIDRIAAVAGTSRTVVKDGLRLAARLGLVLVRERRRRADRSETNIVSVTSAQWRRWLWRGRRGGGVGKPTTTDKPLNRKAGEGRNPVDEPADSLRDDSPRGRLAVAGGGARTRNDMERLNECHRHPPRSPD